MSLAAYASETNNTFFYLHGHEKIKFKRQWGHFPGHLNSALHLWRHKFMVPAVTQTLNPTSIRVLYGKDFIVNRNKI